MNNVLVWGSGFIGSHLAYDKISERATTNPNDIRDILKVYKPNVLINTIGYCGKRNIDDCEIEKEKTIIANTVIPTIIANECEKLGIHFVHIGSGCIFSGASPNSNCSYCGGVFRNTGGCFCPTKFWNEPGWTEDDPPNPVSFYSETKTACDYAIKSLPNIFIARIRMPISSKNDPRNFISKVRQYKQVIDIPNSATFVSDLARVIDWAIENKKTGIYNVVNTDPITAAQVMKEYQKYVPEHTFEIISGNALDRLTRARRSNCILYGNKLRSEGFIMSDTKEMLEKTMKEYVSNMKEGK